MRRGRAFRVTILAALLVAGWRAGSDAAGIHLGMPGALKNRVGGLEAVSPPTTPTGTAAGVLRATYFYSTGSAVSNLGHPVEYRFDWGGAATSDWSVATTAAFSWTIVGTYQVTAEARCQLHPTVTSRSPALSVVVRAAPGSLATWAGDGGSSSGSSVAAPGALAVDASDNLYVLASGTNQIFRVTKSDDLLHLVAGRGLGGGYWDNGQPAASAGLGALSGLAVDGSGTVYFSNVGNYLVGKVVSPGGILTIVAGTRSSGYNGDGIPATTARVVPGGLTLAPSGDRATVTGVALGW
ncbi:MAG: hypothetical protein AAB368_15745, partial [bacterium]